MKILSVVIFLSLLLSCGKDASKEGILLKGTVDDDMDLPAVEVNGTKLHVRTFGKKENPAIIVLHGGPGGTMDGLLRLKDKHNGYALTDEYFMIFYDQRGAGQSRRYGTIAEAQGHEIKELTAAEALKDLNAIVHKYSKDKKVTLFGHSWGGTHATQYVNTYPDKVAGVILSEPGFMSSALEEEIPAFELDLTGEGTNDMMWMTHFFTDDEHARLDYMMSVGYVNMGGMADFYHPSTKDPMPVGRYGTAANVNYWTDLMDGEKKKFDFTTNLKKFITKVLCINGDLNEILTPAYQKKNLAAYPKVEIKTIKNVGHDLPWVAAAQHVSMMKSYLDEVLASEDE